jgi:hypothetical protein
LPSSINTKVTTDETVIDFYWLAMPEHGCPKFTNTGSIAIKLLNCANCNANLCCARDPIGARFTLFTIVLLFLPNIGVNNNRMVRSNIRKIV